jgi:hypothetical protein
MTNTNFYKGDQDDEADTKPTTVQEVSWFVARHPIIVVGALAGVYALGFQSGHSRALLDVIRAAASSTVK